MGIPGSANPMLFGGAAAYQINQSLRFNSADSAYLNRTAGTPTDNKKWTWSAWAKISGASQALNFASSGSGTSMYFGLETSQGDNFIMQIAGTRVYKSTAIFRDPSAWYHIVFVFDSANGTQADRSILYINGVRQAATTASVTLNQTTGFNAASTAMNIGYSNAWTATSSDYFSGYLAEVHFIDGQALTPSSFGETDTITGAWIPKKYSGSYGANGFYINFSDNSGTTSTTLGKDSSGNGNNWTPNNFSVTAGAGNDVMSDTPTNNWCTLNPLVVIPRGTISNGNLNYLSGSTASHGSAAGSFTLPTTGKWYWEVTACANSGGSGNNEAIGIANIQNNPQLPASGSEIGSRSGDYAYRSSAARVSGGSSVSYGATYTNGDVIGVAWDSDAGTLVFYKNGSSQGTAYSSITQEAGKYAPASSNAESSNGDDFNFGQRAFAYTPPTGFKALNTANLPEPTIKKGGAHFNTVLWTGTSAENAITGVGFQPDWVWIKGRTNTTNHVLTDAVRGATKVLESDSTAAEYTVAQSVKSFNSDGITLGTDNDVNNSAAGYNQYVGWFWKANGAGSSNTAGSITSTVSANASAGFSIVTYTGTGSNATVGHGLGVAPSMIITKRRDAANFNWVVWHTATGNVNPLPYLNLNGTAGVTNSDSSVMPGTATSTTFPVGTWSGINASGGTYVAYCFSEVASFSKFGSYTGNSSSDGVFVHCGFRPRWILFKNTSNSIATHWVMADSARSEYNAVDDVLYASLANAETAPFGSTGYVDFLSNGFKLRYNWDYVNAGYTYIFAAFAELPAKYSNAR